MRPCPKGVFNSVSMLGRAPREGAEIYLISSTVHISYSCRTSSFLTLHIWIPAMVKCRMTIQDQLSDKYKDRRIQQLCPASSIIPSPPDYEKRNHGMVEEAELKGKEDFQEVLGLV